ncbi:MAG: TonB-dependent receptor family protein [Myxococcota bacterium]|nr:TonB-dependent receptor [Myxococcota bacterium]
MTPLLLLTLLAADSPNYETVVRATGAQLSPDALPFATTVIEPDRIRDGRQEATLAEALISVPGVSAVNRDDFAQDLRLSIRGFGARSSFGVRGVTIIVDGIPQSLADGQAQLDAIDPSVLGRLELLRGPAGALYGNAAGGVLLIESSMDDAGLSANAHGTIGAYGGRKLVGVLQGTVDDTGMHASVAHFATDGYRDHAGAATTNARLKLKQRLWTATDVSLTVAYSNAPKADDPGGLTGTERHFTPRIASPAALNFDTGEALEEAQAGAVLTTALTDTQHLRVSGFFLRRDFSSTVPTRTVDFDRNFFGGGAHYVWNPEVAGRAHTLGVGLDLRQQADDRTNDTNDAGNAVEPRLIDQRETVRSVGAYLHGLARLTDALSLLASARHDNVRFSVDDHLGAGSGARTMRATTFLGGASYALTASHNVYANVAQAFQTPTTVELALPGGGLNRDLDPERALSSELGARGRVFGIRYDVAVYYIRLTDELIPFQDADQRTFYRNAGKSRRWGAEASLGAKPVRGLTVNVAATVLDARFTTYESGGIDRSGNRVPGIEPLRLGGTVAYIAPWGTFAGTDMAYVGHTFADDGNTVTNRSATIVDVRVGQRNSFGPLTGELFVGLRNLFLDRYDDNVRINAAGGRYFEPAAPRTLYAGGGVTWAF